MHRGNSVAYDDEPEADDLEPTVEETASRLRALIAGTLSRWEASSWAGRWVGASDAAVSDPRVWEALVALSMADMIRTDAEALASSEEVFLFGAFEFRRWLDELVSSR